MLYFQLSEPEYNQLRSVQEQLGLISGLISGTHPGCSLEIVTAQQWQSFVKAQEEVLAKIGDALEERGAVNSPDKSSSAPEPI